MSECKLQASINELKAKIKIWEKKFEADNDAKPGKDDIENADPSIKALYHQYFKQKKQAQKDESSQGNKEEDKTWGFSLNKKTSDVKVKRSTDSSFYNRLSSKLKKHSSLENSNACSIQKFRFQNGNSDSEESIPVKFNSEDSARPALIRVKSNGLSTNNQTPKVTETKSKELPLASDADFKPKQNVIWGRNNARSLKSRSVNAGWLDRCDVSLSPTPSEPKSSTNKEGSCAVPPRQNIAESSWPSPTLMDDRNLIQEKPEYETKSEGIQDGGRTGEIGEKKPEFERNSSTDEPTMEFGGSFGENSNFDVGPTLKTDGNVKGKTQKRKMEESSKSSSKKTCVAVSSSSKCSSSHLERKMASGTQNENFVRINLKKKRFARGHASSSAAGNKFNKWKKYKAMKRDQSDSQLPTSACFRCGDLGHQARFCPKNKGNKLLPSEEADSKEIDESHFLSLEEAEQLAQGIKPLQNGSTVVKIHQAPKSPEIPTSSKIDDSVYEFKVSQSSQQSSKTASEPLFSALPDGSLQATPSLVYEALNKMGFEDFRAGQETAVMRILSGLSTLVVLSTGSGKSLCYQLPAYIYAKEKNYLTLVISPLVSLMEDQVTGLPPCLKGACYHTNQTQAQRKKVLEAVTDGKCDILLVSPEAIVGGNGNSAFLPARLPPIAFVCIDEVHCVSEWSHNFRPSYLRLCKVLFERYQVKCLLGLTATATLTTIKSISHHLNIQDFNNALIKGSTVPDNLVLSASRDYNKDEALLNLLKGERFSQCKSIIIYCTRRQLTERLATLMRTSFRVESEANTKPRKRGRAISIVAEAYHAGLSAAQRRSVQNHFMSGELRIVVATVAFGMGLDKSDVRAIIHYNMPKSFESYVQEIGRAGRDGLPAHCHVFLDADGNDMNELKRHVYSNSVDRHTVRKLIKRIFPNECRCSKDGKCKKHEVAVNIQRAVFDLDIKEESISTLLCYLELHPKKWIEVLNPVYSTCEIKFYNGAKSMKSIAQKCPPIAAAIALQIQQGEFNSQAGNLLFPVVEVSSKMDWNSATVKRELKSLEWNNSLLKVGQKPQRTGVVVEFSNLAFHMNAQANLSNDELDEILDFLYNRLLMQEQSELYQLAQVFNALSSTSHANYWACSEKANVERSEKLKTSLCTYFNQQSSEQSGRLDKLLFGQEEKMDELANGENGLKEEHMNRIRSDIRDFVFTHTDHNFSGRAIARIFHGIASPCYPADVWGRVRKFWRCHLNVDFNVLTRMANKELINIKS